MRQAFAVATFIALSATLGCQRRAPERPATISGVLWIEGMPETTTFRLVSDSKKRMSIYVPEDMVSPRYSIAEPEKPSAARRHSLIRLGFASSPDEHVDIMTTITIALGSTRKELTHSRYLKPPSYIHAPSPRIPHRYHWTEEEYDLTGIWAGAPLVLDGSRAVGQILVGRHDGWFFHITEYYPVEMADGLGPRHKAILDSWIWTDTGQPLDPGSSRASSGKR